jgi:hypothetical protein
MAQPTGTHSTYDTIGIREDLEGAIYKVDPADTPFYAMAEKLTVKQTKHEWQTQALAAANGDNAVIEGDDATTDAATATVRLDNYTQISDKVAQVSGTNRSVEAAGRGDELAYQLVLKGMELRRDIETILLANQAKVAGNDTTARRVGAIEAWLATNTDHAGDGADPAGTGADARTDGTPRAFTETMLKDVLQGCWENGGKPDTLMMGAYNRRQFSTFTGASTRFDAGEDKRLVASIELYVSDWGEVRAVANRFMRASSALALDMDYWGVGCLADRRFRMHPLAKTGDTDRHQILSEYTLIAKNEKASGIVADLTAS